MEFIINNSPVLTMADITKLLFNRNFLSDVQFHVAGKTIYAHSLELMKRSIVFQKQLITTLGVNKLIPINDVSYDSVYQFVRFIYNDDCKIDKSNVIGLLKLATRYKVIKLENAVIRVISGIEMYLSLYEYCLLENNQLYLCRSQTIINQCLGKCLASKQFLIIHPVVMEEILKTEHANVSEFEIFEGLARWIEQNSKDNQIEYHRQRVHYQKYIRLIRFPVMSVEEIFNCSTKYSYLFKYGDFKFFNQQKRNPPQDLYIWMNQQNETVFTVIREMLFIGVRFGCDIKQSTVQLIISQTNLVTSIVETVKMDYASTLDYSSHHIQLGESIRLRPNMRYTIKIEFKSLPGSGEVDIGSRNKNVNIFTNVSRDFIQFTEESRNIFDMYFKLIDDVDLNN